MSLIKLENISKYYKSGEGVSVGMQKVSLEFNIGEFVAVTGESGSGKSTLLNVISGLDTYEDGELYIQDEETSHFVIKDWENYRSKYIGFIFQNYNIIDSFTVYENVLLALEIQNYPRKERKKRALELIERVGLTSHKNHKASKLSGGQKQRAVIARALAKDCPIIVADEPTGNLDSESSKQVISLLQELSKDKLIVIVTHDYDQVKHIATRHIKMHDGEVVEDKKLKTVVITETSIEPSVKPMSIGTVMLFALRNLLSRPRLLIFFTALQVMIILVFTMTYSNSMYTARNDVISFDVGNPQNTAYFDFETSGISDNRMNVVRKDGEDFTASDYQTLKNLSGQNHYVYEGVIDIDTRLIDNLYYFSFNMNRDYVHGFKVDTTYFLEKNPQFLVSGKVNNLAANEIVISNDLQLEVGQTVYSDIEIPKEETLVAEFNGDYKYSVPSSFFQDKDLYYYMIVWHITFTNREPMSLGIPVDSIDFQYRLEPDELDDIASISSTIYYREIVTNSYIIAGKYNDNNRGIVYFPHQHQTPSGKQTASIITRNDVAAKRLFNSIDTSVYRVIYPAGEENAFNQLLAPLNFVVSLFFYAFIYLFAIFLYFILYSVMKNVMSSRKKDFAIFRSIGANESKLGMLVIFEQLYMMILSFIITLIIVNILSDYNFAMQTILTQLLPIDYIVLFLTFGYLSIWLARRFNKKTFRISVIENLTESREDTL